MQKSPISDKLSTTKGVLSPKRTFDASTFDEFDSENIDPAVFDSPSKKSKSDVLDYPVKPLTFSLSTIDSSMPPPATVPSRLSTPARIKQSSPRAPLTAPAGRSPKRKSAGVFKNRRTSAPFTRIDPPFSSRFSSTLPFSLDAALSGTAPSAAAASQSAGATIHESMPKTWFFDIYEDTPEEEAANLMEHSTLTLDLSSDDESSKKDKEYRGKENTPPEDYDGPTASRPAAEPIAAPKPIKVSEIVRKKKAVDEMDDGQRSPLSDLETDSFIPAGLDKDSHVVVDPTPEKSTKKLNISDLFATPVPFTAGSEEKASPSTFCDMPVVDSLVEVKGKIIVYQDGDCSSHA